jgi:hypothetical protein
MLIARCLRFVDGNITAFGSLNLMAANLVATDDRAAHVSADRNPSTSHGMCATALRNCATNILEVACRDVAAGYFVTNDFARKTLQKFTTKSAFPGPGLYRFSTEGAFFRLVGHQDLHRIPIV